MSHNPERKEKDCLNCGAQVAGRFCQACGQENIETKESSWSLTKHFVYDILHFDGKFFYTLKYIITRPGFVAKEYVQGRRASYLHPIRMYLFASALFFLTFFTFAGKDFLKGLSDADVGARFENTDRLAIAGRWQRQLDRGQVDSGFAKRIRLLRDTATPVNIDSIGLRDSAMLFAVVAGERYASLAEYRAGQDSLPEKKKDGWIKRRLVTKTLEAARSVGGSRTGVGVYLETFLHKLPYFLFLSLPFFALILKLLYVRRKHLFYSDHAVFTLYHYIFSFILLLAVMGVSLVYDLTHWKAVNYLVTALSVWWAVYLLLELKNFYRQGWAKTLLKYVLLVLFGFFVIVLLFIFFLLFLFLQS